MAASAGHDGPGRRPHPIRSKNYNLERLNARDRLGIKVAPGLTIVPAFETSNPCRAQRGGVFLRQTDLIKRAAGSA